MKKLYYPAVFHPEEVGYSVWIPDVAGCVSQGDDLGKAIENIKDALGLFYEESRETGEPLPAASVPDKVETEPESGEFVALVEFDPIAYLKANDKRAVKKTLTIPSWLNSVAEERHINFSSVLQAALISQLGL